MRPNHLAPFPARGRGAVPPFPRRKGGRAVRLLASLLLALAILVGATASPAAAEPEWVERRTEHVLLRFAPNDAVEVDWYEGFVEDVYRYVSEVFDQEPQPGIVVTFYSDEAAYSEANPLAGRDEGVLAHARLDTREVGLALFRLRRQSETLRRDAVSHELTHVVLGEMSNNKLTIGFHEGLAQYVEREVDQRSRLARLLRRGVDGQRLLSFEDLNRQRSFLARAAVAYPQSYSVVAFLSERYGFGHLVRMVNALQDDISLDEAARRAFGRSLSELEAEWQLFVPGFINGGWGRNDLDLWEMAEPRRLLAEGRYTEAQDGFQRAERLFADLGRVEKLEQARAHLRQSWSALEATDLGQRGAAALEVHDYATATGLLGQAATLWSSVGDAGRRDVAESGLGQARRGEEAMDRLEQARALLAAWQIPSARARAVEAGTAFAELGDVRRTDEAGAVLEEAQAFQTRLGAAAVGGGAVGLTTIGLAWGVGRVRRHRPGRAEGRPYAPPVAVGAREQDWSL